MLSFDQIQKIAESPVPILTVYLNTQNRNASRHPRIPGDLAWFKKETLTFSRTLLARDAARFQKEVTRVATFLEGRHPEERALSIFAGPKTWTVLPLQTSVKNEIQWGKPAIGQLFSMLSEHRSYGVVVMDLHAARFFSFLLGELTKLDEKRFDIDESQWKRKDVGHVGSERIRKAHGSDRDLFEHRLKAQYERLYRETADQTIALSKQHAFARVFLVGHERLLSPMRDKFPPAVRERLVLVPEDFGNFSPRGILRRLEPRIADYEEKRQVADVEQVLAADSGSITDADETLARLQDGAIRTVLVVADHDFHLRECEQCGNANRSSDLVCADCGGKRRSIALLDLLPRLSAVHGTKVEFVGGKAAQNLAKAGGLAGWLRQTKSTAAG